MTVAQFKAFLSALPELRSAGVTRLKWGDLEVDLTAPAESAQTVEVGAGSSAGAPQSDAERDDTGTQQTDAAEEDLDIAHTY
jgi:hypothetical protein